MKRTLTLFALAAAIFAGACTSMTAPRRDDCSGYISSGGSEECVPADSTGH